MTGAVLIQHAVGRHEELLRSTMELHAQYARQHDIVYQAILGPLNILCRPPTWWKWILIHRAIQDGFQIVVWLDADCIIVDPREDISCSLHPRNPPVGMVWHQSRYYERQGLHNSGVVVARACVETVDYIWDLWATGKGPYRSINGRQPTWNDNFAVVLIDEEFPGKVQTIDNKWNHGWASPSPAPVVHGFHGAGVEGTLASIQKLLPEVQKRYHETEGRAAALCQEI